MLAFAAKLAGPLVALVAVAFPASLAVERTPEHSFTENLARYSSSRAQILRQPPAPQLPSIRVPRPSEPSKKDAFTTVGPQIDALLAEQPEAQVGIAVRWSNGETLYLRNANEPFPMASVAKVYMLVAYLERLATEHRTPDPEEFDLLTSMIEVSDNDSAQEIWDALGGLDAMQGYLHSIGMRPFTDPPSAAQDAGDEEGAWGDASQTASQMSLFLARLREGELLDPISTQLASSFLGAVVEEQSWGVSSKVDQLDPGAKVLFKNGWYPTDDGRWRINTAGIILPDNGTLPYVIVIFGHGFESWQSGIDTVDAISALLNQVMLG
jgi:beta-lactamase class A